MMQGGSNSSMSDRFQAQTIKGVASKSVVRTKAMGGSKPSFSDDIDDDDGLLELGLCSEALIHLQDMKDTLINISNDLIDNFEEMTSEKIENLRQERQQLNKQIQLLEKYLHTTSVNEERKMSHFSASTATPMAYQFIPLESQLKTMLNALQKNLVKNGQWNT